MSKYGYRRNGFNFRDFTITKREIIASISIIAVMLIIGILISNKISEHQMDENEKYNKAAKIESTDLFKHGMDTNVGNAFVYGDLKAIDTVTYPEIGGEYMYVKKVKQKYTMHTRTVTYTVNGKTHTRTETYWTWDNVSTDDKKSNQLSFCGITFNSNKIEIPYSSYITTIKESSRIRYKYYGVNANLKGTLFTNLSDGTISNNSSFYDNMNINETVEHLQSGGWGIIFWFFWIILIGGCVYGFFYLENDWLEDNQN